MYGKRLFKIQQSVLEDQKLLMPPSLKLLFSLAYSSRILPATERYEIRYGKDR
jgi:hypothetical protein